MQMRFRTRHVASVLILAGLTAVSAFGDSFAASGTTQLSVTVSAEAAISIDTSSTNLTTTGSLFTDYTGTTSFTYKIRTDTAVASGIVLQITSDFDGVGGPSVAHPPTAGDALTYTCAVTATSATGCSSAQTATVTGTTKVASFGADAHSAKGGDAGSVSWTLTNDPKYKVGSYKATATFTISAT